MMKTMRSAFLGEHENSIEPSQTFMVSRESTSRNKENRQQKTEILGERHLPIPSAPCPLQESYQDTNFGLSSFLPRPRNDAGRERRQACWVFVKNLCACVVRWFQVFASMASAFSRIRDLMVIRKYQEAESSIEPPSGSVTSDYHVILFNGDH